MDRGIHDADPARHYDRVTEAWQIILGDALHHGLFTDPDSDLATATGNLTRAMAATAALRPGDRIVDLGCGTGTQACWLASQHPGITVVGVTSSAVGATLARDRSEAAGLADAVSIRCADAYASGLDDASCDVVWLLESSQYLPPPAKLMAECARLLAPGGRLALCDSMLIRPLELRDLRRWHEELEVLSAAFGEAVMGTAAEYRDAAVAVGLEVTDEQDLTERVIPTYARWRDRARQERDRVADLIGEHGIDTFIAACDVMEEVLSKGIVGYTLIGARVVDQPG